MDHNAVQLVQLWRSPIAEADRAIAGLHQLHLATAWETKREAQQPSQTKFSGLVSRKKSNLPSKIVQTAVDRLCLLVQTQSPSQIEDKHYTTVRSLPLEVLSQFPLHHSDQQYP